MENVEKNNPMSTIKGSRRLITIGIIGSAVAAICCFTPVLVGLLAVIGLGALTGYLDFVLLPALVFFLGLLAYGLIRQRSMVAECCTESLYGKEKGP